MVRQRRSEHLWSTEECHRNLVSSLNHHLQFNVMHINWGPDLMRVPHFWNIKNYYSCNGDRVSDSSTPRLEHLKRIKYVVFSCIFPDSQEGGSNIFRRSKFTMEFRMEAQPSFLGLMFIQLLYAHLTLRTKVLLVITFSYLRGFRRDSCSLKRHLGNFLCFNL